jgi:hypothetical protein
MNKLIILSIILVILLGLYWYQSKLDDKYESMNEENIERISLTDNDNESIINNSESEEDNRTLKSFNMDVFNGESFKDSHRDPDNNSKTNKLINDNDSQFTDSDLREEPNNMEDNLDEIE